MSVGASCDKVRYALGDPAIFRVSVGRTDTPRELDDIGASEIPKGRKYCDYDLWVYELPFGAELNIQFSNERKVVEIDCATGQRVQTCPAISGVQDGAGEAEIENAFGQPENKKLVNLGDTLAIKLLLLYPSRGLTFVLERDHLTQIVLSNK